MDTREEFVDATSLDWFKEEMEKETPHGNLRFYRGLVGMSRKELAEKLGMTKQHVCDMENGRVPISRNTARALADIFHLSPVRFV